MRLGIVLALTIPAAFTIFVLLVFKGASLEVPLVQSLFIFVPTVVLGLTALAIWSEKERDMVRETFGRYLSEEIVTEILKSPGGINLSGELREVGLLVTDLRGFTPMTESLPPQTVVKVINRYLERMIDIVGSYGGVIDEFTGDGILAFFGAPRPLPDYIRRAVACAVEMQEAMTALNQANIDSGLPELRMGIGITSGTVIVGNIGSEKRKKYGATGKAVNLAFRIEAQTAGAEILVGPNVYEAVGEHLVIDSERVANLKGIEQPVKLYRVTGMKS
jgi:class 3 adenylate cyclase